MKLVGWIVSAWPALNARDETMEIKSKGEDISFLWA